jgi:hypothetical protein
MIYYGFYGPFRTSIESQLLDQLDGLITTVREATAP